MGNKINIVISGFRREAGENCALLVCYTASIGNSIPTFRDNLDLGFLALEDGALVPPSRIQERSR
jgi:hypothetical protein